MNHHLTGQRIIVTGVTGGIAQATTKRLAEAGAEVIVSARSQSKLETALSTLPDTVTGHTMDLRDHDSVAGFFDRIGGFDHLVTPAATSMFAPIREMDFAGARELLETKQWGQMLCVHHGAKHIASDGSITLFSGTVTQKPLPGSSPFASVGAATEAAARVWAFELAPIRVNTIVPGVIDTPIWGTLLEEEAAQEAAKSFAAALPVGRVGQADDVAKAVTFLIDNGFVDGLSLVVDGGHRLI